MSKTKELIERVIQRKPLDVKEIVEELMAEKAKVVIAEKFDDYDPTDELTEEQEAEAFFEEFAAEYGHLPLDEQEKIMNEIMAEAEAELDEDNDDAEELDESQTTCSNENCVNVFNQKDYPEGNGKCKECDKPKSKKKDK